MMNPLIDALAIYRATRLITEDWMPFGPTREKIYNTFPHSLITELVGCPWCISLWVAAGAVTARATAPALWSPLARILALSAATGLLSTWENKN